MPLIHGRYLTKREYMQRVGDAGQCFGVREVELASGKASMARCYEADIGSGLRFTVCVSKGFDICDLSFSGISFGFRTKAGYGSPWISDEQGMAYRNSLGAGFLYTAGLSNVGLGVEEGGFYHNTHGNLKNTPAENVSCSTEWSGDDCVIMLSADVRDSAFFGRNLLLHREITANVGEKRLFINDTVENQGFSDEQIMLLYHMNLGYPVLDEDTRLIAPVIRDETLTEHTAKNDKNYSVMTAPVDNNEEYLYALKLGRGSDGMTSCAAYNERLGLGLYVRYNTDWLKYLIEWKCMSSGDYALGLLPSTCRPFGREANRRNGDLRLLPPFGKFENRLEIGVIEGDGELEEYKRSIESMK